MQMTTKEHHISVGYTYVLAKPCLISSVTLGKDSKPKRLEYETSITNLGRYKNAVHMVGLHSQSFCDHSRNFA